MYSTIGGLNIPKEDFKSHFTAKPTRKIELRSKVLINN